MKKVIQIGLCILILFSISCKKKPKKTGSNTENEIEKVSDNLNASSKEQKKIKDCDDFLDQYEEWMNDYVDFLAEYKDNPVEMVSNPRYGEILSNMTAWATDWSVIATSCAVNDDYDERFKEISDKIEEKMKNLGFKK